MQCPSCSAPLQDGARFCGVCGHKIARAPSSFLPEDEGATYIDPQQALFDAAGDNNADPFTGMVLNERFIVEDKLGEGGFGAVYRGTQLGTGRKVAIKLLHPDMSRDKNLVARFRREGMVLCNLRDAHTVTTYDFAQTPDGTLYIAMELLQGRSLQDVFETDAPLPWQRMLKIVTEMCSSLAEAHAQGIVHRDLKPENIYLENWPGQADFVKILDFGIAKVMRGDGGGPATQLTATGQTLGTLEYMSPEQLMGRELDGRSDVYALGVLTYEMITARLPFPDAKGPAGLITAQLRSVPEPPSTVVPGQGIPPRVDELVLKMLAKEASQRFPDVTALRDACLELMGQASAAPAPAPAMAYAPTMAPTDAFAPTAPRPASAAPVSEQGKAAPRPANERVSLPMTIAPGSLNQADVKQALASAEQGARPESHPGNPAPAQAAPAASKGSLLWLWIALGLLAAGGGVTAILLLK